MAYRSAILSLALASVPLVAGTPQLTDDSKCNCYVTNGSEVAYFSKHFFYDFRSLSQYQGEPAVLTSINESANASPTSKFFSTSSWTKQWSIQSWNNSNGARGDSTIYMQNSPNNVYIQENTDPNPSSDTYLTLRTIRLDGFQSAAEIESSAGSFKYISMRMLARTVGSPGACTAMFTYRAPPNGNAQAVQEADLEIRTKDPRNTIQYTNQPSLTAGGEIINQATANATMPGGLDWSNWAVHRFDWTPSTSTWYIDGVKVASISFQTPRDPSQVILNSWSDGGDWTGNMSLHDAAYLQVQWFDMVYNSSSTSTAAQEKKKRGWGLLERRGDACNTVCSIDETNITGTPVMISSSAAYRAGVMEIGVVKWVPAVVMVVLLLVSSSVAL